MTLLILFCQFVISEIIFLISAEKLFDKFSGLSNGISVKNIYSKESQNSLKS